MKPPFHQLLSGDKLRPGSRQDLERNLRRAQGDVERTAEQLEALNERLDQFSVFSMAMWNLLKEVTELDDDRLNEAIAELAEQRDEGAAEGAKQCPQCQRVMSLRLNRCLYCSPGE